MAEPTLPQVTSLHEAVELFGEEALLALFNRHAEAELQESGGVAETPLVDRAEEAEHMLNQYHLLMTNLRTRQAIYHTICARSQVAAQITAIKAVEQAQAELDQCKYEILSMMGIDS